MERVYIGTEVKFKVTLNCSGFSMHSDNFTAKVKNGKKELNFTKSQFVEDIDHNFYLCFDTKDIGVGTVELIVTAYVPDADFPDGFRSEIAKTKLIVVNPL